MSRGGLALALVVAIAGCPRLPLPAPRPAARLLELARIERGGGAAAAGVEPGGMALRARIEVVNRGAAALVLSAVDWEIAAGGRAVVRGRADLERAFGPDERAAVDLVLAIPAGRALELRRGAAAEGGRVRLRGVAHMIDVGGGAGAPAPFDDGAPLP